MPEKKQGMMSILKIVFKGKRNFGEDIIYQAEKVVSQYISIRKNEIIGRYSKKSKLLGFMTWGLAGLIGVCVFHLIF